MYLYINRNTLGRLSDEISSPSAIDIIKSHKVRQANIPPCTGSRFPSTIVALKRVLLIITSIIILNYIESIRFATEFSARRFNKEVERIPAISSIAHIIILAPLLGDTE
jgi:hypothetical protein